MLSSLLKQLSPTPVPQNSGFPFGPGLSHLVSHFLLLHESPGGQHRPSQHSVSQQTSSPFASLHIVFVLSQHKFPFTQFPLLQHIPPHSVSPVPFELQSTHLSLSQIFPSGQQPSCASGLCLVALGSLQTLPVGQGLSSIQRPLVGIHTLPHCCSSAVHFCLQSSPSCDGKGHIQSPSDPFILGSSQIGIHLFKVVSNFDPFPQFWANCLATKYIRIPKKIS